MEICRTVMTTISWRRMLVLCTTARRWLRLVKSRTATRIAAWPCLQAGGLDLRLQIEVEFLEAMLLAVRASCG